jgi:hypothetical protein
MPIRERRTWWRNCCGPDDDEFGVIDAMEDSIAPLEEQTIRIRRLITGFEACYHEADKEAEAIAGAIGAGRGPEGSNERPPERKKELESARHILAMWCGHPTIKGIDREVGGIGADELLSFLGEPSPLKLWQVARVVDRVSHALDPNHPYHNLVLDVGEHGEPGASAVGEHYKDHLGFLRQTHATGIHDTVDGRESKISLAYAIDLLMPCGWDFAECLVTILKAIGGDLHPQRPFACCSRNIRLSPLCGRLRPIANTLKVFWTDGTAAGNIDRDILASLGTPTPVKRWLAASLDKTIRLHLSQPFDTDLF